MILVDPLPVASIAGTLEGAARLATPSPREAAVAGAAGVRAIDVDFGAAVSLDTVFVGYSNLADGAAMALGGGPGGFGEIAIGGYLPIAATRLPRRPRHLVTVLPAPVTLRYLRLALAAPAGMELGVFAAGLAIRADNEWGAGRFVVDRGFDRRAGGWACSLADLSDATLDAFYGLQLDVGTTRPLLVIEDPTPGPGLNERIHWCRFARLDTYERRSLGRTRTDLRIEDWD